MKVEIKNVEGLNFIGKGDSNHWVALDGPEEHGGFEAGTRPMEMVLIGLGGCTGMDVISLLNKMRVEYDDLQIEIEASRKEEYPKIFTDIHIHYKVFGEDPSENKVKKAIDKSQNKYCSVSAMLQEAADIEYDYEIIRD